MNTRLIAEIGLNHGGNLERAKKLVSLSRDSEVWGVKFQYFKVQSLINLKYYSNILKLKQNFEKSLEQLLLNDKEFIELILYTINLNIPFGISFFSYNDFLFFKNYFQKETGFDLFKKISFLKVASGEITDYPLLYQYYEVIKDYEIDIVISTGLSNDNEINEALKILDPDKKYKNKITLLHCIVEYPTNFKKANLKRIKYLKNTFDYLSGLSDHSIGFIIPLLSLKYKPAIIEKHFTDNNKLQYADNPISTEASDFKIISSIIKDYEKINGNGQLILTDKEIKELTYARKGVYALKKIGKGELFTYNNIITQRPNLGYNSAYDFLKIINKPSKKIYKKGEPIKIDEESND